MRTTESRSEMDEVAVNKAFQVGFDRTEDLLELVPDDLDGEAELAHRWDMTPRKAVKHVTRVLD